MTSTVIDAVVFDFGGVLTLAPPHHHFETLRNLCGLDIETLRREYTRQRPDYDRGTIDSREYWNRVVDSRKKPAEPQVIRSLFQADAEGWNRINQPMLEWAFSLQAAGMRTGILSNMPRDILGWIEERFRWIDRFEVRIFSCDLGVNKPQPPIYRECLDALALQGDRVLFIDDRVENVEGAKRAGFRAVLFRGFEDCLGEISRQGWLSAEPGTDREHG
ncbi:MAG: HAD family phosphatase [Spirochaetales bacterium]|nr:HAD family phosphatase [Spirochaetales bacterium]